MMTKQKHRVVSVGLSGLLMAGLALPAALAAEPAAATAPAVVVAIPPLDLVAYPVAILPFEERGSGAAGMAGKVGDILFAKLVTEPDLQLVDRADLKKTTDELGLNVSGMVSADKAVKLGEFTGAKILVSGSVIEAGGSLFLVAKVIGTETSRVVGASVKGSARDNLVGLTEKLADATAKVIRDRSGELVAKPRTDQDVIADLKKALGDSVRPKVAVHITEQHLGRVVPDPAAETEYGLLLKATGFEVVTDDAAADVVISGEGFSETAGQFGNLISAKARLEVTATRSKDKQVLAVDRQTTVAVDLAEHVAGKTALQRAAAATALRLLPKVTGAAK
ncbi:MAG: CsgG/HfaB family protein [Lentisphaeria bacterium]